MKYTLIRVDGTEIIKYGRPSPHISEWEASCHCCGEAVIFETTIDLFEKARDLLGKPIKINSFYRCKKHQEKLLKTNKNAAKMSPHLTGTALDLGLPNGVDALTLMGYFIQAADDLGLPRPRFGYKQYNYQFLHTDLVFMRFAPFTNVPYPCKAWVPGVTW